MKKAVLTQKAWGFLAGAFALACLMFLALPAQALADVTVTGSDQTYSSLTDAAAAVRTNGTTGAITYTVTGETEFNGGYGGAYNTLAPECHDQWHEWCASYSDGQLRRSLVYSAQRS